MVNRTGIICFRHTSETKNIFCKEVPDVCPICRLRISSYFVEPFEIPYPYTRALDEPITIVIRPSKGKFLNDYELSDDLHIGVVNSVGRVFEYDRNGIMVDDHPRWMDCIAFKVVPTSWDAHWDETLRTTLTNAKWNASNYDSYTMNCFNFVLDFLNALNYPDLKYTNKENICRKLILPKIQDVLKYNRLFRHLCENDYFISN